MFYMQKLKYEYLVKLDRSTQKPSGRPLSKTCRPFLDPWWLFLILQVVRHCRLWAEALGAKAGILPDPVIKHFGHAAIYSRAFC